MDLLESTLITEPEPLLTDRPDAMKDPIPPRDLSLALNVASVKTLIEALRPLIIVLVKGQAAFVDSEIDEQSVIKPKFKGPKFEVKD
jgi:hypothetical protein